MLEQALPIFFKAFTLKQLPMWRLSAGMLGASFVAMQTYVVPVVGVALFTVAPLAGQTAISLWIDHVSLAGGIKSVISKRRVIAVVTTVCERNLQFVISSISP
jgi:transporter family-2 protein